MQTESYAFLFTKEEVLRYSELSGVQNLVFHSLEAAQEQGYAGIPLPPALVMTAYRHIDIPWQLVEPVIHRKQECRLHETMYAGEIYTGTVTITKYSTRQNRTFIEQKLEILNEQGKTCFSGISHLIAGGIIEKNSV